MGAVLCRVGVGRGHTGGDRTVADVFYRNLRLNGRRLDAFPASDAEGRADDDGERRLPKVVVSVPGTDELTDYVFEVTGDVEKLEPNEDSGPVDEITRRGEKVRVEGAVGSGDDRFAFSGDRVGRTGSTSPAERRPPELCHRKSYRLRLTMTDTHEVTVTSIHQMTPDVKQFVLESDGHTFEFDPGQHTHIHFEREDDEAESEGNGAESGGETEEVVRPYTSTALPGTQKITLAIKRYPDGTASTWMHERDPGDTIDIEELGGNLYLRDLDSDVAFVSTGTGITPMMAMVKQYVEEGSGQATFFFGEKDQQHIFYRETLDQLEAQNENLEVVYVLSEADEGWPGPEGHVQDHLADYLDDFGDRDFYVCGVPEMVVETQEYLAKQGADEDDVYVEGWEGDEVADESEG